MTDISSYTGKFRARKSTSDGISTSKITKRPRASHVCNRCRSSKLRCNRRQPCDNCVKRTEPEACSYEHLPAVTFDIPSNAVAEERLSHLESTVKDLLQQLRSGRGDEPTVVTRTSTSLATIDIGTGADRARYGRSQESAYAGSTHWTALLNDIDELRDILGGSAEDRAFCKLSTTRDQGSPNEVIFGSPYNYSIQQIISEYLPPRLEVDRLLSIFLQGQIFIIPFIHKYHFQDQYRQFWCDTAAVNPLWLSMLFSICCIASLKKEKSDIKVESGTSSNAASYAFDRAAGYCLVAGEYNRPQEYAVEALAIYAHCKNFRTLDPSRESGAVLAIAMRLAYEMGYHRDPDSFKSFTVFESEMRRRCFAAVKQMDLSMSFMLGLPSTICLENCDTRSPSNLLDSDFNQDTKVLPSSRPESEYPGRLWFIVKERQMPAFSRVCRDALSFRENSEAEILQLDQDVRDMAVTIPDILMIRPVSDSIADPPLLVLTRVYLHFIYLKSLLVLHRKYMTRGYLFSTRVCIEAGKELVAHFIDVYKEFAPGGQLQNERGMLTSFTINDFLLGVMALCLVVYTGRKPPSQNSTIDSATGAEILGLLEQAQAICIENSRGSRDAKRVSHAIRITLSRARESGDPNMNTRLPELLPFLPHDFQKRSVNPEGINGADFSSQYQTGQIQPEVTSFGILDPFDFTTTDINSIDWTVLDSQFPAQDVAYL